MNFPETWPSDCPPPDAVDAEGDVFRIADHDLPTAADFLTSFETGTFPTRPACSRCGLSVHRILSDAIHTKSKYPKLGSRIAKGTLAKECGKTKPTGHGSHTTWWVYEGVTRANMFVLVSEEV